MTLTGLFIPLITPFDAGGAVALDSLEALARRMLEAGASGLVALGTTGEPSSLTEAERQAVVDVAAIVCREHDAKLIVGAGTPQALEDLRGRGEVHAALTVVPPFVRPGEAGTIAYLTQLAANSPVPLVIYHVPYRTGQALSASALTRLGSLPGVVGVKYAAGITEDAIELMAALPPHFAVLGGDDLFISPLLALGAQGGILASAHLATEQFVALIDAWHTGDVATARALGHRLARLSRALFAEPNPTVIKAALHAQGLIPTPAVRLPLLPAGHHSLTALDVLIPA
ncbi:4-hydroxy-tetrahydrodipicolinate synthase [Kribbella voronezhensis]|uniref:4-hydroxy-tetrahydrodipicolinate synthase n=1 Tax=Kribbella voronezhensis TaxID=2512212 RepID=A0A4R7SZJ6_9ACTN|nr:dihydrodipicolinate synthase family protein [Kribbella voronezhensis]TDU84359.1 4-hydroxy-tetrahydrodipicolinate synthase [Kribbella voronezhensis]